MLAMGALAQVLLEQGDVSASQKLQAELRSLARSDDRDEPGSWRF